MKLSADQLPQRLMAADGALAAPLWLIHGDEPLLQQEAADSVRDAARGLGFSEREVHEVDHRYDWASLSAAAGTLSLFATRRLLELRLVKPLGAEGGKALKAYCERRDPDTVVLVLSPRLDGKAARAAWFKALVAIAAVVAVYPIDGMRLQQWVAARMRARGLRPDADAVRLLAEREEGNLLACVQDIEKLALLHGEGPVSAEQVATAVADNARFDVFALGDAALEGRTDRVVRIIGTLRAEGVAEPLVLWVLSREIRGLAKLAAEVAAGRSIDQVCQSVWPKNRVPVMKGALRRVSAARCRGLLEWAARVDRCIKGADPAQPWDGLLALGVGLAATGRPPVKF